jgi:hypothetical protein
VLSGLVRNTRYVSREEPGAIESGQPETSRAATACGALIALRRSSEWWQLGRQIRREILETQSDRITSGLQYLSAIVQRWQHPRDLSGQFDCVTWFEYELRDSAAFDDLLFAWRASEGWNYVDRECEIRVVGAG